MGAGIDRGGGELLGLPGMVIGVPAFATVMSVVKETAEWCLRYKGIDKEGKLLPEGTEVADPFAEDRPHDDDDDRPAGNGLLHRIPFRRKTRMKA